MFKAKACKFVEREHKDERQGGEPNDVTREGGVAETFPRGCALTTPGGYLNGSQVRLLLSSSILLLSSLKPPTSNAQR